MSSFAEHDLKYENGDKTLHYLSAGPDDGELMIFMHGWPGLGKTWHYQLTEFANKGFKVVAPDMPGYGGSTARKVKSDYAQETIIVGMLALLKHLGRSKAIWVAHDWGSGTLWTLARKHPEVCTAVCSMAVPYAILEFGYKEAVKYVDRELYPEDKFPYGQWAYMVFYEQEFEKATEWFEKNTRSFLKIGFSKGDPSSIGKPAFTATVIEDGGWFGGVPQLPPADLIPDENLCIDKETLEELTAAMEKTGFWAADAWYANHDANAAFNSADGGKDAHLKMPVLFIEAEYDSICETTTSRFGERQQQLCDDLTHVSISAGHFVQVEKWEEVNRAIAAWLDTKVKIA